jgi:long-chain fatty acid transport protein
MLYDQSAEAMGKASAVVASAREPSAIWYNPAGLAFAPGYQASATGILYYVKSRFVQEGSGAQTQAEPALAPAGAFFAAGPVTRAVSVGIGAYSAFGLGLAWPEAWIGRENAIRSSLTTYTFNPSVALRLCDHLSLGAGFDVLRAVADQTNGLPAAVGGTVRVGGATWGYGANVGLLARVVPDRVHAAAAYRSRVSLSFDGRADFAPANQEFSRDLRDQGGTASATLPDILTAGLMVRTAQGVELAGEASLVRWSA